MQRNKSFVRLSLVLALVCWLGLLVWAAPIIPARQRATDQVRSMKGIQAICLQIDPMPKDIERIDITATKVELEWSKQLEEAGIQVTEEDGAPTLRLIVSTVTDPQVPGGVAYNPYLVLEQLVRIERIDDQVVAPT